MIRRYRQRRRWFPNLDTHVVACRGKGSGIFGVPGYAVDAAGVVGPPEEPGVAVVAEHHSPAIRSGPGFADLRDLAARAGLPTRHPPFGFYAGVFGYTVEATADEPVGAGCGPTVHVRVRLFLAERVV